MAEEDYGRPQFEPSTEGARQHWSAATMARGVKAQSTWAVDFSPVQFPETM